MDKSIFFILTQILPELVNKQNLYEKNRKFYNLTFIKWLKRIRRFKTKFMKSILTKDQAILQNALSLYSRKLCDKGKGYSNL